VIGILGTYEDITARKLAEDALRDRYRDLVESSQDLVCTHDLSGRILSVNLKQAQLLGYARDELLAMRQLADPSYSLEIINRPATHMPYPHALSGRIHEARF
jgi:PAS domain-containing protein